MSSIPDPHTRWVGTPTHRVLLTQESLLSLVERLEDNPSLVSLDLGDSNRWMRPLEIRAIAQALISNSNLTHLNLTSAFRLTEHTSDLTQVLMLNSNLAHLSLTSTNLRGTNALAQTLGINSSLTHLDLRFNRFGAEGASALAQALIVNSTLTRLDLDDNHTGDEGASALAQAVRINTTLTHLSLDQNRIGVEGTSALSLALGINSTLTDLNLGYNSIGDEGTSALAQALRINSTLTHLDLSGSIENEKIRDLVEGLIVNSGLTSLNLSELELDTAGGNAIGDLIIRNSNISTLNLEGSLNNIENAGYLVEALKTNSSLTNLRLGHNIHFKDADYLKDFVLALNDKTALTSLGLDNAEISPEGAQVLAQNLAHNSSLISLDLAGNNIFDYSTTIAGAVSIAEILKVNTTLTKINLYYNSLGVRDARELAAALTHNSTLLEFDFNLAFSEEGPSEVESAIQKIIAVNCHNASMHSLQLVTLCSGEIFQNRFSRHYLPDS